MTAIKRYGQITVGITHYPIQPTEKGPYIMFSDHQKAMREERAKWATVCDNMTAEIDRLRTELAALSGK